MNRPSGGETDRYDDEQQRLWQQLHQVLEQLKVELEATHVEISQGLQISRQPLVSFMQHPDKRDLPIHRVNLIKLWDFLTNPALLEHKKISEIARQKRLAFREQGADRLLTAAGFAPMLHPNRSGREQQIQRITSMLTSLPDIGFANFNELINDLESVVRSRAFPSVNRTPGPDIDSVPSLSIVERIQTLFSEPLQSEILHPAVLSQIKKFLTVTSASGYFELTNRELFELSLCILNHEKLSKTFNRYININVQQYQFTVLTFSLHHFLVDDAARLKADLKQAEFNVESLLMRVMLQSDNALEDGLMEIDSTERPLIVEAQVICNFSDIGEDICWLYRSSATHLENVLTAMAIGIGCSDRLELVESSTRTLGQKGYALVKASTAFCDISSKANIYESVWVDRSTIKAFLQSSLTAAIKWLSDQLSSHNDYANYYKVCHAVARIETALAHGRKLLNDYAFQQISGTGVVGASSAKLHLGKQVIDQVKELQQDILSHSPVLQECYGAYLERQSCFANLTCARSAHIEGNLIQAQEFLENVRVSLHGNSDIRQCLEIQLLYEAEWMLHQFFSGNRDFLLKKSWRSSFESWLTDLSEYIAQENLKYGKYPGRFDFNTYLCASEVFGRITRLNLCFSTAEDIEALEESIQLSMQAAYCSSRIGYRQRAAHWLVNAARIHCRLGDASHKAEALCNTALKIIHRSLDPAYSDQYVEPSLAEVNLAHGERLLLVEGNSSAAITYFLKSLKGAIYIDFTRLTADSLYGIARAASTLTDQRVIQSIETAFNLEAPNSNSFLLNSQRQAQGTIAAEIIDFFNALDKNQSWNSVSVHFKDQAKWIWQSWYEATHPQQGGTHPIADQIEAGTYLSRLVPKA
ncbi:MAG: hypothetical protein ACKO7W_16010 [Elainella sp.]